MGESRIRMRDSYGQTPPNVYEDFDWIHQHEAELLEKYGECSIIVFKGQVMGVGDSYTAALDDAEHNLVSGSYEITPVHWQLRHRHPFLRVRPSSDQP